MPRADLQHGTYGVLTEGGAGHDAHGTIAENYTDTDTHLSEPQNAGVSSDW